MTFQRTAFLAAFAATVLLPSSSPLMAAADLLPAAPAAEGTPAAAPVIETLPVLPALPTIDSFEPIGGGLASFYGRELAGARTASGQRFDPAALTAAHRTLPFGSRVQVTNPATGISVVVTINDRGPFHSNRVIDLSEAAAREIGIARSGSGRVNLALVQAGN